LDWSIPDSWLDPYACDAVLGNHLRGAGLAATDQALGISYRIFCPCGDRVVPWHGYFRIHDDSE